MALAGWANSAIAPSGAGAPRESVATPRGLAIKPALTRSMLASSSCRLASSDSNVPMRCDTACCSP